MIKIILLFSAIICENISLAEVIGDLYTKADKGIERSYSTDHYIRSGMVNLQNREWDSAITNFTKCLSLNSNDVRAYYGYGMAYFEKGDFDTAIINYTHIIGLSPQEFAAYLNRGNTYRVKQRYDEAIADFNECIKLSPTNDLAYKYRASAYAGKTNYVESIRDYTAGLGLNPNDAKALVSRASAYLKTQHFSEAIQDYKTAIQIDPEYYNAYNDFAWFRATCPVEAMRNAKEAIEYATKACQLTAWKKWECIDTLGIAFAENGDFEQAITYEKKAIVLKRLSDSTLSEMQGRILLYRQKQSIRELNSTRQP